WFFRPLLYQLSYLGERLILRENSAANRMVQGAMVRQPCAAWSHMVYATRHNRAETIALIQRHRPSRPWRSLDHVTPAEPKKMRFRRTSRRPRRPRPLLPG